MITIKCYHVCTVDVEMNVYIISNDVIFVIADIFEGTINMFGPMSICEKNKLTTGLYNQYTTEELLNADSLWLTAIASYLNITVNYYDITTVDEYLEVGCFDVPSQDRLTHWDTVHQI